MSEEIFKVFIGLWILVALAVFITLFYITAPYGRHTKTTWGPLIDNKTGWIIMEFFVLVVLYYFVFSGRHKQSPANFLIIGLFSIHYLNRSLIFPFRLRTRGKKMPLSIVAMGMTFNLANGFIIGYYLGNFKIYQASWLLSPQFLTGMLIFFAGLVINWRSDTHLIHLRTPGDTGYKIPGGGLFNYVSCPNLMGEGIEWAGFAILTWSLPGLAFFIWTLANLLPRALAHHRWYRQKFPDYPPERKAMIPFLL